LAHVWVDGAYRPLFIAYVWHMHAIQTQISRLRDAATVAHKLWVVERYRHLSKDYEYHTFISENWIYIAMSHLLVKRLGRS
jgi:hypothetical protein